MARTLARTTLSAGEGQMTPAGGWSATGWAMGSLGLDIGGVVKDLCCILSLRSCEGEEGYGGRRIVEGGALGHR